MEDVKITAVTVSQIHAYIKDRLRQDENLIGLTVTGELSNFTHHKSGHFYFTLKDENAGIRCIMFRSLAQKVKFAPKDGMKLLVKGNVSLYERDGSVNLSVSAMEPDGIGALQLAFEQLKEKLGREGLFDPAHKRPLPPYPSCIAVVTSKTGAALQDILQILSRRYPLTSVRLYPALVQGEAAPDSIAAGIEAAGADEKAELMIVGRGGGAAEDLWCFNDERVARAVYASPIPVISAVGHETDFTICDFAADLRAPTPSAAAELAVPDMAELAQTIRQLYRRVGTSVRETYRRRSEQVKYCYARLQAASPQGRVEKNTQQLALLQNRISEAMAHQMTVLTHSLAQNAAKLEAMSPLKVLTRGYSITMRGQTVVDSAEKVQIGDELMIRLRDGALKAITVQVSKEGEKQDEN